jgi:hypothetical protein
VKFTYVPVAVGPVFLTSSWGELLDHKNKESILICSAAIRSKASGTFVKGSFFSSSALYK